MTKFRLAWKSSTGNSNGDGDKFFLKCFVDGVRGSTNGGCKARMAMILAALGALRSRRMYEHNGRAERLNTYNVYNTYP
jgi:hypothetical protein